MNILLTTLNSKFIHTALSIRYLKSYCKGEFPSIEIEEYTINQNTDYIAREIYKKNPDIVAFSSYIWNMRETLEITEILKMVNPNIIIILGGPEVSYNAEDILNDNSHIDYIIYGEGEETLKQLLLSIKNKSDIKLVEGVVYRDGQNIYTNSPRVLIENLDSIPSPFDDDIESFRNKIAYFESSRGCPFNCQFCLSSTIKGVRFFSLERAKSDLKKLIDIGVSQVKFVDRTFNAKKGYAMEIMNFIVEQNTKGINFHFEVTAHLVDDEMLDFLENIKEGLFQFEVGVQSTNPDTLKAIDRTTDFKKLSYVINRINSFNNIHQHLDLIAGLPYEGYESFKKSFNDVYSIRPEKLQLGFLKLLKGSGLRLDEKKHGYKYLDSPLYEVLANDYISYGEIIKLKGIEDLVEKYYNEGYFLHSLEYITKNYFDDCFSFYEDFSFYWETKGYTKVSHSKNSLYEIFMEYFMYKELSGKDVFTELLKLDYIMNNRKSKLPAGLNREYDVTVQKNLHEILKSEQLLNTYLKEYKDIPTKKLVNKVIVEDFKVNVFGIIHNEYKPIEIKNKIYILFDYIGGEIIKCKYYDITEIVKGLI